MRRYGIVLLGWLLIGLAGFGVASAIEVPANRLVETEWLADHLDADGLRIVDVRGEITAYWEGHLPGAVYLNIEALRLAKNGVPVMYIDPDLFTKKLGKMGITPETTVIVYTDSGDYKAAYFAWGLDYIGHERFAILNGGYGKWLAEDLPVTQDYPSIAPATYPSPNRVHDEIRATLTEVQALLENPRVARLDVRVPALYLGERGFWKRNGHIPGFKSRFWGDDLNPDGTWKDVETLRNDYAALGVTSEKRIIVMCGQGLMSAHTYFTLRHVLGYAHVENYDGGFHDWVAHDDLPVAQGAE